MVKVKNKDTRTMSTTSLWKTCSVSIIDFELMSVIKLKIRSTDMKIDIPRTQKKSDEERRNINKHKDTTVPEKQQIGLGLKSQKRKE